MIAIALVPTTLKKKYLLYLRSFVVVVRMFDLAKPSSLCVSANALLMRQSCDFGEHMMATTSFITAVEKPRELQRDGVWGDKDMRMNPSSYRGTE
jgi:hypothetical protein